MDRHYCQAHALTLAQHPSETDERVMVRLLAFALHADDALAFGKDLGPGDEPVLWRRQLTGDIDLWIELGQPGRSASARPAHGARAGRPFLWERLKPPLQRVSWHDFRPAAVGRFCVIKPV